MIPLQRLALPRTCAQTGRDCPRLLRRRVALAGCVFLAAVLSIGPLAGARVAGQRGKAGASPCVLAPDKGKLKILLNGQPVGAEEFEISSSGDAWTAKGSTEMQAPGAQPTRVKATLELGPDGSPKSYEWASLSEKKSSAQIVFENGLARIVLQMEGAKPFQQDVSFGAPLVVILDNNLYHQYEILAHVYDWSKKGAQTFPLLVPQDMTPGTITAEAAGTQSLNGKSYEGLRVSTADLEVMVYLDSARRLMRLEVPASKVSIVRE